METANGWLKPHPHCYRCKGTARLVTYRRNGDDQAPTWTCASCVGLEAEYSYHTVGVFELKGVTIERPAPPEAHATFMPRRDPNSMKPRYTGPRAKHDPMR